MTTHAWLELLASFGLLVVCAVPLGEALGWFCERPATSLERRLLRWAGVDASAQMTWKEWALGLLLFNLLGTLLVFAIERFQHWLPLNPAGFAAVEPWVAINTAVSFVTNTNWQAYGGETTMSHFTQMAALTTQNFVSAATGIAVLLALLRGLTRASSQVLGNFWLDLVRATAVLLPLATLWTALLVGQGVPQTLAGQVEVAQLESTIPQRLAVGPVASQVAIKQLGTNGGGFYNANSAHPLENPTPASNTLEWLAILLVPAALCFTFGRLVHDRRQGWVLFAAMAIVLVPVTLFGLWAELRGVPALTSLGVDPSLGHLEGKEARFGVVSSVLWANATTAASNGSVNAMHDSLTPLAGLGPLWLMQLGEVVFGGVGSGLYGLLLHVIVAVFIAGLMVGRTPEYLGKKIEATEMKLASLGILLPSIATLAGTALATRFGAEFLGNPGAHGFSELLYALSSTANNNGSAFGGLTVNGPFFAGLLAVTMAIGRYWVIIPVLAIAGSLARKKRIPVSAGTLPTHTPLFVLLLVATLVLVGALTFLPALALGPVVEHLTMTGTSP